MTNKKTQRVLILGLLIATVITATVLIVRAANHPFKLLTRKITPTSQQPQGQAKQVSTPRRNLSMQPHAFQMARSLGGRFSGNGREKSVFLGTITTASDSRQIHIVRTQTEDGEQLEINVAGKQGPLKWDAATGALSSNSHATGSDRELIERIVYDSPDQLILAQLRGAAYYTVQRNVRPANADDTYSGPVWDVVRITDPEPDASKQPLSRWRLYYLNVRTGLIDKIESQVAGQRVVAEILNWTDVNGEKVPAQIQWTSNGQSVMQYSLSAFSNAPN